MTVQGTTGGLSYFEEKTWPGLLELNRDVLMNSFQKRSEIPICADVQKKSQNTSGK